MNYDNLLDNLPEPPPYLVKKPVIQLTAKQIDKAHQLGLSLECAQQLLVTIYKLFEVPALLDGSKVYPMVAIYFSTTNRIPTPIQRLSVQMTDVDNYRIVQVPLAKLLDYLGSLPGAKQDPVCQMPVFN